MGLLDKVARGEIGPKRAVMAPIAPPQEEKIKVRIALKSGKLEIDQHQEQLGTAKQRHGPIHRTPIGIEMLDHETEGGFVRGSVNLIGGGPGCGKSIFCMQFLVRGIDKYDENGLFISFEQPEEKILQDMSRFNWKLEEKIAAKKLSILYFTPEQLEKILESGSGLLKDMIDYISPKRLVIDSLNAFAILYSDETEQRKALSKLFELVHKWDITTLATLERESDHDRHEASVLEFGTDSVILVYNEKHKKSRVRSLEIYKMRGTKHAQRTFSMNISDKGLAVGAAQ